MKYRKWEDKRDKLWRKRGPWQKIWKRIEKMDTGYNKICSLFTAY